MAGEAPIIAESADGVRHEFPAGTETSVIDTVMRSYAEEKAPSERTRAPEVTPEPVSGALKGIAKGAGQGLAAAPGGLISAYGSMVAGAATASKAYQERPRNDLTEQVKIAEMVDGGVNISARHTDAENTVALAGSALKFARAYAAQSPEQRAATRKGLDEQIAAMPKFEDTLPGKITTGIQKELGPAISAVGQADIKHAEELIPLTEEEEGRFGVKTAKILSGLVPYIVAGGAAGIPGLIGYGGVESFGHTFEEAKKAGADDETATAAAALSGFVQGGLNAVPAHKALQVADQIPKMFRGEFIKTVVEMAKSAGTLVGFTQVSKVVDNAIAKDTFDPKRSLTDGLGEDLGPTAVAGAILPLGIAGVAGAANRFRAKTPTETVKPVLDAPDVDSAITAARAVVDAEPVDTAAVAAGAREFGSVAEQQQSKLLQLFGGLNDGEVVRTPDGAYHYRTGEEGAEKLTALKVWDERTVKPPAEGEAAPTTISPQLARAQRDTYGRLGIDVVYFADEGGKIPFDGATDPRNPNTIFLSNEPQRNAAQVGSHEVTHVLESTRLPDGISLADLMHGQIGEGMTPEGLRHAYETFGQSAPERAAFPDGPHGDSVHADAVWRHLITELGADIGGEAPKFQTFLPKVVDAVQARYGVDAAKAVVQKLIAGFQQAMRRLREFFSRPDEMAEYGQPNTVSQHWVTNLGEIHDTLAKMWAERFGTQAERENAALREMRDRAERDRVAAQPEPPAAEVPPPTAPEGFITPEAPPKGLPAPAAGYSEAAGKAATYRRWLGQLDEQRRQEAPASPQMALLRQTEAAILAKVRGVESRLTNVATARLEAVRAQIDGLLHPVGDSPGMARVREAMAVEQGRMAKAAAVGTGPAPGTARAGAVETATRPAAAEPAQRGRAVMPDPQAGKSPEIPREVPAAREVKPEAQFSPKLDWVRRAFTAVLPKGEVWVEKAFNAYADVRAAKTQNTAEFSRVLESALRRYDLAEADYNRFAERVGRLSLDDAGRLQQAIEQRSAQGLTYVPPEAPTARRRGPITDVEMIEQPQIGEGADPQTRFSPKQTETPEFKRWFGDSKVVDDEGKPLVVYHGMKGDLEGGAFDPARIGDTWAADERGFFFISDPRLASEYASGDTVGLSSAEPGAAIVPAYVSLKKPLVIDDAFLKSEGMAAIGKTEDVVSFWDNYQGLIHEWMDARESDGVILVDRSGSGEPIRMVVALKPEQIKSAIGNTGTFDPANPDIRMSPKMPTANPTRTYTPEQEAANKAIGAEIDQPTFKEWVANKTRGQGEKTVIATLDRYYGIKADDPTGYMGLRLSNTAAGAIKWFREFGALKFDGATYDFKDRSGGVEALIKGLGPEAGDFARWVAGHRAEILKAEGRENLLDGAAIAGLKTLNQGALAQPYTLANGRETTSREAAYLDALKKYHAINKNVMDLVVESGLMKQSVADGFLANPFYIPFYRVDPVAGEQFVAPGTRSASVGQKAFEKLKGGTEKLNHDLWENADSNWSHLIEAALKNKNAIPVLQTAVQQGAAVKVTAQEYSHLSDKQQKANTVWVMENGEKQYYRIENEGLMAAVSVLDPISNNALVRTGKAFKTLLQVGVTMNPYFAVKNLTRDVQQVLATTPISWNVANNLYTGFKENNLGRALANVANAATGEYFQKVKGADMSDTAASALAGGALMRMGDRTDSGIRQLKIGDMFIDTPDAAMSLWKGIKVAAEAYREAMAQSEDVSRIALFKQLKDQGASQSFAAFSAKDIADFTLTGAAPLVRTAIAMSAFTNPRLQGLYKIARSAADADQSVAAAVGTKVATNIAIRTAKVIAAGALVGLALDALYADDEDYKKRDEMDRNTNYWFKIGSTEFRIPKGFEIGALSSMSAMFIESFYDKEMTASRVAKNFGTILADNLNLNPTPTAIKPLVDVALNKSAATGSPIVGKGLDRLQADQRYSGSNTLAARGVSTAINSALRLTPFNIDGPSPIQLDYLTRAYGGWLATTSMQISDIAARSFTSEPVRPAGDLLSTLTGGIASSEPRASSRYVNLLYDQADGIEKAFNTYKDMLQRGQAAEAQQFFKDNKEEIQKHGMVAGLMRLEGNLNKQIRMVSNNPDPGVTAEQKRLQIMQLTAIKNRAAQQVMGVP